MRNILIGIKNKVAGKNDDLYCKRLAICSHCPLYKNDFLLGYICSNKRYINGNGEVSLSPKDGYVKGCGCIIALKARVEDEHCIINKW